MELDHSFSVPAPAQDLWPIVQDVPRIAACLPGATIDPSSGSPYSGGIKVKVGPIAMTYRGTID
uniref:SRPBCC domain-containing protein n=1 Tax=Pseudactinotalea sp. TaxID=1926260 RepID=UPI003B3B7806